MKNHPKILLIIALSCLLGACVKEDITYDGGEPVTILFDVSTRAGENWQGSTEDNTIESMRVLVYESVSGQLKWNRVIEGMSPHLIEMTTGVFDFVFIANESSDTAPDGLNAKLASESNYNTIDKLHTLTIHYTAFGIKKVLPMVAYYPGVKVEGDNTVGYTDPFSGAVHPAALGTWSVSVEHTGVCVSMSVQLIEEQYDRWMMEGTHRGQIGIYNIPDRVFLLPGIDNSGFQFASEIWVDASTEPSWDAPSGTDEPSADGHTVFCRVVLPELFFAPSSDESKALVLTMDIGGTKTAKILAPSDEDFGYTLPRNTWLHLRGVTIEIPTPPQLPEPTLNTENARITWDAANRRYALAANMTDAGLYFMFGSVAGIFTSDGEVSTLPMGENDDEFDAGDLAWNPTGVTGSGAASWLTIPRFDGQADLVDYPAGSLIDAGYHTAANVKAGKGDPCRLVGLDLAYILATPASALTVADIDDGRWRMPIRAENIAFCDYTYHSTTNYHWKTWPNGVAGGVFPRVDTGTDATTLPATGYRTAQDGAVNDQDISGFYWSSEVGSATDALSMKFDNTMICANEYNNTYRGMSVRCVSQ